MLNKIIRFSLDNRAVVLTLAVMLLLGGVYLVRNMEVDVFPDLNAPTVVVMTEAQGMAAEEVESLVTFPVETAVNGAAGVRRVRSASTTGFSVVWIEFDWGTEIFRARQIVSEKLAALAGTLPENTGPPVMGPQSSILGELLTIGITSDSTSLLDLRTIADWTVRPRLLSVGGVAQVAVIGGDVKEYQIVLDPARMKHYGVTLDEVLSAVGEMNRNAPGGVLSEHGNEYIVRGMLQTTDVESLGLALVKTGTGGPVQLRDVAEVRTGARTPRLGLAAEKGKPAVLLTVTKQPETSTIELTGKLEAALAEIRSTLPADVKLSTDIFRQDRFIRSSIGNVRKALLEGSVFVVLVLFFFLMNTRTTFISLVALPLSLLVSVVVLKLMGLTLNTMSLGGMAIAIGSLVDDAIIDVENVFRHLRLNRAKPPEERQSIRTVVFEASREVRIPILNSTLIIVVSFIPLFFLGGMEGRMLVPLGIAFVTALFASTLVALTVTPVLCSCLPGREKPGGERGEPRWIGAMKTGYRSSLEWALQHKKAVLSAIGLLLASAIVIFFTLGRSFLPPFNEGSFTIGVNAMPGISLEESDKLARQVEEALLTIPEIQTLGRKTGRAELDEHALGVNVSEIEAPFELGRRNRDELLAEVRRKLGAIPGISVEIGQPISHRIDAMLSGTRANIAIKLFGNDLNRLYTLANRIKSSIGNVEGIVDLNVEQLIERPQLKIIPRREMLSRYGITLPAFAQFIRVMLAGEVMSQVYDGGRTFDLTVKAEDDLKDRADRIRNLMIDADGGKIPLGQVADVVSSGGPDAIHRENVQRRIVVSANVTGGDLRGAVNDIQKRIASELQLPEGYHIEYGGQFESEQSASRVLTVASVLSLLVIFLLLFGQFRSVGQSAVVLLNLPLALIGGVYAIWMTTGEISIPAIIGFISLFGIATRNGILLMSHYGTLRQSGRTLRESIVEGSLDRLNPILMTALSSGLALVPLAAQGGLPGNEIQSPMAKVILGGLLTSTLLNMYIVPIIYAMMNAKKTLPDGPAAD